MKGLSLLHMALGLVLPSLATAQNASAPVVDLGYVKYQGYTNATAGINYYRGIRYAQSPTGALRWQKPVPIENASGTAVQTLAATTLGPACIQGYPEWNYASSASGFGNTPQGQSEDCLLLDVLVPSSQTTGDSSSSKQLLPVMVQIHGGGYTVGNAQSYPGDALVHASKGGLIYVSIQYRLGIFGFLAGRDVAENGVQNAGLWDQRLALEWVQRHIAAFGGDPDQVTIWGGSAGGGSVTYQLMYEGGEKEAAPFRAAIAEYPWWQPLLNHSTQELQYSLALDACACADVACLRNLSEAQLTFVGQRDFNESYPGVGNGYGSFWFGPVVDGVFLQELPSEAFKKGRYYKVPLIVDREGYEGLAFSNSSQTSQVDETTDAKNLFPNGGPGFFSRVYQLYPAEDYNATVFQRQSWFGDFIINCPTYQMASGAVDTHPNSSTVFKLVFDAGSQLHGATVPFLADSIINFPNANNKTLAKIMSSYWISFATTMDPNPLRASVAPFWPSYVSGGDGTAAEGESVGFTVQNITYASILPTEDPDARVQCEFFSNKGFTLRN